MITVSDAVPFAIKCSLQISLVRENVREKKKKKDKNKRQETNANTNHMFTCPPVTGLAAGWANRVPPWVRGMVRPQAPHGKTRKQEKTK